MARKKAVPEEEAKPEVVETEVTEAKPVEMKQVDKRDAEIEELKKQLEELWEIVNDDDKDDDEMMKLVEAKLHEITPTFVRACNVQ